MSGKVCGSNGRRKREFLGNIILNQEQCVVGPWIGEKRCSLCAVGYSGNRTL